MEKALLRLVRRQVVGAKRGQRLHLPAVRWIRSYQGQVPKAKCQPGENRMRFRLYSIMAILAALLLMPLTGGAQQQEEPSQPAPQAGEQPSGEPAQEKMPEAPIEPVLSGPYPVMSPAAENRARQIFEMFNHGETGQMWASLSEPLRKRSGKEETFTKINQAYRKRMGIEVAMLEENIVPYIMAPDTIYSRLSKMGGAIVPIMFIITINQRGQIDAFDIKAMPDVPEGQYAGYEDTAKLKLPFEGQWLVFQGGRNLFDNPNASNDDTRFSVDFAYLKNGRLFSGAGGIGSKVQDYYCFGQPILAPADGTVVRAIGGYDDNPPGMPSGDPADGNMVVILHENDDVRESSVFNHLKQNSLKVKSGDKVKQGQVIAECGNSGAGPVPHLHYQLRKTASAPLPAQFVDYIANGKPVASGEPKKGQFVKNQTGESGSITTSSGHATLGTTTPASGSTNTPMPAQKTGH